MLNQIGTIRRCEQNFVRCRMEAYDLHPIDGVALRTLNYCKSCNQDTLCEVMNIDKGRIAKTMARLEEKKLIRRIVNENNRREKLIELTMEGLKMTETVNSIISQWNEICFTGFSPEEREQYMHFLDRIAENAAAQRKEERHHG